LIIEKMQMDGWIEKDRIVIVGGGGGSWRE
jgi:hypothetical protein